MTGKGFPGLSEKYLLLIIMPEFELEQFVWNKLCHTCVSMLKSQKKRKKKVYLYSQIASDIDKKLIDVD